MTAPTVFARPKTDIVYFKNGDRITCEIKRLEQGRLSVSAAYTDGSISIDWSLVERVESSQGFTVELQNGELITGTIEATPGQASESPGLIISGADPRRVTNPEVATIRQEEDVWYQSLHASLDVGMIYAKSNDQTQLAANAELSYTKPLWDITAETHTNFSTIAGVQTSNRSSNRLQATRYFGHRWLAVGIADFLKSDEQSLDLRATYGGGLGRDFIRTPRTSFTALAGLVATQENYSENSGNESRKNIESLISAQYRFFRFKKTDFVGAVSVYPSLSDLGRIRMDSSLTTRFELFKNFYINLSLYSNFDSRPPVNGRRSDYGGNTGIGYSF